MVLTLIKFVVCGRPFFANLVAQKAYSITEMQAHTHICYVYMCMNAYDQILNSLVIYSHALSCLPFL